jgi:hypothetical protein
MATQWYEYDDGAGTKYGVALSDAQQVIYAALVGALPTGYATLAALQAAVPGVLAFPPGLAARYVNITSTFFGTAQMVVLTDASMNAIEPTGSTPFPLASVVVSDTMSITGAVGESRLSN